MQTFFLARSHALRSILALACFAALQACDSDENSSGSAGPGGAGGSGAASSSSSGGAGGSGGNGGNGGNGGTSSSSTGEGGNGGSGGSGGNGGNGGGSMGLPSTTASKVAAGRLHACAITAAGGVRCWGYTNAGQLGNGAPLAEVAVPNPVEVTGLDAGVSAISTSIDHTCAVHSGAAKCWGLNSKGQLGNNSTTSSAVPVTVSGLDSGVAAVAAGYSHSCALTTGGAVKCWGLNDKGQLGNDSQTDSKIPVDVVGLSSGAKAIAVGHYQSCAITASGGLKCWGGNIFGELGNDSNVESHVPVDVLGLASGVTAVAAGELETCALTTSGAKCWGNNDHGQLGDNNGGLGVESHVPVAVSGLDAATLAISVGYGYACGIAKGGAAKCWGYNTSGEIGNGSTSGFETSVPVDVTGLGSGVAAISAGSSTACAITSSGAVKCWGKNDGGQLGNGTQDDALTPVNVISLP